MMKYTSLTLILFAVLSCSNPNGNQNTGEIEEMAAKPVEFKDAVKISADVSGTYKGILPCDDCDGIETILMLEPDESYEVSKKYIGKSGGVYENIGSYEWSDDGTTLILEDIDSNKEYYTVEQDKLRLITDKSQKSKDSDDKSYELIKQSK